MLRVEGNLLQSGSDGIGEPCGEGGERSDSGGSDLGGNGFERDGNEGVGSRGGIGRGRELLQSREFVREGLSSFDLVFESFDGSEDLAGSNRFAENLR